MGLTFASNTQKLNIDVKSAGLLIHSEGKYLICHATRFDSGFSRDDGHWGIPKGIVEGNDSLLDTAIRETLEETGLNIRQMTNRGDVRVYSDILFRYKATKKVVYAYYVDSKIDLTRKVLRCTSKIDGRDLPENDAFCWVEWLVARSMVSKRQKELFSDENFAKIVDKSRST